LKQTSSICRQVLWTTRVVRGLLSVTLLSLFWGAGVVPSQADSSASILHSTIDYGGGRIVSANYVADVSLGGFGGIATVANATATVRLGYPGQLNEPPTAPDNTLECPAGWSLKTLDLMLLANDTDAENDPLLITSVASGRTNINVALDGSWIVYTPFTGSGTFDTFTYTVSDGYGASTIVKVKVTVGAPINLPNPNLVHLALLPALGSGARPVRLLMPAWPKFILQGSTNLPYWSPLWTNAPSGELVDYIDASAIDQPYRFYRIQPYQLPLHVFSLPYPEVLSDRSIQLLLQGPGQFLTVLQVSSDLVQWSPLTTNLTHNSALTFVDERARGYPFKFYRALFPQ